MGSDAPSPKPVGCVKTGHSYCRTPLAGEGIASGGGGGYPRSMSTIQEIEDAIRLLPEDDLAKFRAWFAEFDASAWDRQFERDVAEGLLDALADEALLDA
jgi:hypothetical protein